LRRIEALVVYDVAIATRDSKLRYLSINLVEKLGLDFVICAPNESVCASSKCIISTSDEIEELHSHVERAVLIDDEFDMDTVGIEVMSVLHDMKEPNSVSIGVDPGMRYGLVLLLNGVNIYSRIRSSPRKAANTTAHWSRIISRLFSKPKVHVRIGTGSRLYLALYLRELQSTKLHLIVELVNEHRTSLRGADDISSAALIATRRGKIFRGNNLSLEYKLGYIRSLQKYVKQVTDGLMQLSSDDARDVLSGSSSIDDFLESFNQ
jgi:hypothetical protein